MKFANKSITIMLTFAIAIAMISCSSSSKNRDFPVAPDLSNVELPTTLETDDIHGRCVLAVYDAVIDPDAKTFTVTPSQRIADYHFPLTQLYPNVLQITGYGWAPNFWADIKLTHPFPGSGIDAFDPRIIAILPANPGVSFYYPVFNCIGNNKVVREPDGYTKLFDNLGGSILGNTNPFKAYFKDQPYRRWSSIGATTETQRWQMKLSGFGGSMQYKLVVDVSTNYPNPPTPVTDNAPEPVEIDAIVGSGLTQLGGIAEITVTILDWQGRMSVGGVQVEAPDLFEGTISLDYLDPGPNPNEYVYAGIISNEKLAPEGEYDYLVASWDQARNLYTYNEFSVEVSYYIICSGNLVWAKRAGGSDADYGNAIITLSDDSTAVTGSFSETATFGTGEPNQTILLSAGNDDIFIARYNPDGSLIWAKRAGGTSLDCGNGITAFSDNYIIVTGLFMGTAIFGQDETNETVLWTAGNSDIFIACFNPDGELTWAKRAGGANIDRGYGITTLSDNSLVVTGIFQGVATFGLGEVNQTEITATGGYDIFIARYNPNGILAWVKSAGGLSFDYSYGISTFSNNMLVITGCFSETSTFGQGEVNQKNLSSTGLDDIFIALYNQDGALSWAQSAGGPSGDVSFGITTLSDNSIVVTGKFFDTATFGLGESNQTELTSAGSSDMFIARYNPDGTLSWAKCFGGEDADSGNGITMLSSDSTVVTGYATGFFWTTRTKRSKDIFIRRYDPNGNPLWAKFAGGPNYDQGRGITTLSDDSTVVTGHFMGTTATFGRGEQNQTILWASSEDIFTARFER